MRCALCESSELIKRGGVWPCCLVRACYVLALFTSKNSRPPEDQMWSEPPLEWARRMEEDNSLNVQLFDGHIETWRLVLTSFFCWVITSLSVAAGIGGGGLLVPLYSIILGLGPKLAVPVSKATIFGVALGNAPIILRQRHPTADRPLVDYTIVTLMQSGVLLGVVLGVLLNLLLPEIAIVVLLALVLGFTGYKTVNKGRKQWATETKARAKVDPTVTAGQTVEAAGEESCAGSSGEAGGTTPSSPPPSPPERDVKHVSAYEMSGSNGHPPHAQTQVAATAPAVSTDEVEVEAREVSGKGRVDGKGASRGKLLGQAGGEIEGARAPLSPALSHTAAAPGSLERELADDSRAFPPWAWGSLLAMCAFLLAYSLLVNGFIDESINPCSPAYWPIYWLPVPFYVALLAFFARRASSSYERRLALSFPFAAGDIKWTAKTARRLPPVAVCSGAMSGMLGIGGGMLLGPLFISLELQPQVTSAVAWHRHSACPAGPLSHRQ